MAEKQDGQSPKRATPRDRFRIEIGAKERRKMHARRTLRNTWFGFSVFGLVGWSVAIPTLAGISLGVWLDSRHPGRYSWTLMLLVAGLGIGCLNAWHWLSREQKVIRREGEKNNHHD
jgi:ATP synthase protein I